MNAGLSHRHGRMGRHRVDVLLADGVVRTLMGGALVATPHPSYQAWSYAELLRGFNETVYENDVAVHPCAERPMHLPPMIDAYAATAPISPGVVT